MALRIQNNLEALNAHRYLQKSNNALAQSLEKLSSGFRINRAADDAAGLSIAETMRAKVASLRVASRNTLEASSLVQTAEGGMNEIANMLVRLKELATQASSSNAGSDRDKLNSEAAQLLTEIDRIANTTRYAGTVLLTGGYGNSVSASSGLGGATGLSTANVNASGFTGVTGTLLTFANSSATDGYMTLTDGITTQAVSINNSGAQTVTFSSFGVTIKLASDFGATDLNTASITMGKSSTGDPFQVTEKSESSYQISLSIDRVDQTGLGVNGLDLSTQSGAATALGTVDSAISSLNSYRGNIGAVQNRLTYAAANLSISIENTVASESVIRDVDMAFEMTVFTKNQILMQAGTAMLAQANMAPQSILQLLK